MNRCLSTSLAIVLSLCALAELSGQEPPQGGPQRGDGMGRPGGRRGWFGRGEGGGPDASERMARIEQFLRTLDANGNGILEPGEVPPERARFLQFFASRLGLDTSQPIPIARIRELMSNGMGQPGGGAANAAAGASRPDQKPAQPSAKPEAPSLVPGFGSSQVPGFGESVSASTAKPNGPVTTVAATRVAGAQSGDPRRAFREMRFRRYDRNGDGVIDKQEAAEMPGDTKIFDRNHDGRITLNEYLAVTLQAPTGSPPGSAGDGSGSSEAATSEKDKDKEKGTRKSYRFLPPHERLPKGLPDWFTQRDKNHDGQVSMSEYAADWTDGTADEFRQLDSNGDGVLTAQECLKNGGVKTGGHHSGPSTSTGSSPASTAPSTGGSGSSGGSTSGNGSGSSTPWWMR